MPGNQWCHLCFLCHLTQTERSQGRNKINFLHWHLFSVLNKQNSRQTTTDQNQFPVPNFQVGNQASSRLLPKGIVSPNTPLPCFHNHSHLTTLLPLDFPWTQAAKTIFQITSHKGFILQLQYFPSFSFCKSITTLFF